MNDHDLVRRDFVRRLMVLAQLADEGIDIRDHSGFLRQVGHLIAEDPAPEVESETGRRKTCAVCGVELIQQRTGRPRRFCSRRCRNAERNERNLIVVKSSESRRR